MTISKSQGQTLPGNVSVYLKEPVFSHGALYVAMSRVVNPRHLRIFLRRNADRNKYYTKNVVYKTLLQEMKRQQQPINESDDASLDDDDDANDGFVLYGNDDE